MSAINMSAPNTDYDAAQALLDLQGNMKPENPGPYVWRATDNREDMEKTAKLFWNCFISPNNPMVSNINGLESNKKTVTTAEYPRVPTPLENYSNDSRTRLSPKKNIRGHYINFNRKSTEILDSYANIISKGSPKSRLETRKRTVVRNMTKCNETFKPEIKTREMGTQTEECYFNPNIDMMENTIKNLYERIRSLESQLKVSDVPAENSGFVSSENEEKGDEKSYESQSIDYNMSSNENTINGSNTSQHSAYPRKIQSKHFNEYRSTKGQKNNGVVQNGVLTNHNIFPNSSDLVPIGDGHAKVPARLLKHINWNSYTSATRKLLTAVFSRRILATHSLTGKPSPAFPNKPAKKKLNHDFVNDIVQTVVERCSVPENVVRTSITTKCADESKMFKTRQSNKRSRTSKRKWENIPPTTSDSESESS